MEAENAFSPLLASTYVLVKSNVEVSQLPPNGALPLRPALFQRTWRACREAYSRRYHRRVKKCVDARDSTISRLSDEEN
jgi:hypothetical protein